METLRGNTPRFALLALAAFVGVLLGFVAGRSLYMASPVTSLYTPPALQPASIHADGIVIEAYVDAKGRVCNYRIVADPRGAKNLSPEIKNSLIFTTFRPATYMGAPVESTAILSFPNPTARRP